MTKAKKILCALLSVCVIAVPVTAGITSASAESVESLQQRLQDLDSKNKEYQKVLDSAQNDISEKEKYNEALLNKIDNLDEKISVTRESIEKLNAEISESQKKINQGNGEIESQLDALCERLRAIYMAGSASDLEIILGAKDFTDLIDKMSLVKNLSKYDQELIDNVNSKLDVIGKEKETLEKNKAELLQNEASLKTDLNELNTTLEANKEVLKDLYTKTDEAKDFLKNSGDEKAQIESEIAKYFAEQAAAQAKQQQQQQQQQAQSSSSQSSSSSSSTSDDEDDYTPTPTPTPSVTPSSSGGYVWPTPGFYYLSSEWNEDRTTYNHGAIDIGGGDIWGAAVVAADSGTVVDTCTYCTHNYPKAMTDNCGCGGGYGNYVKIDHGNGKVTIYAHFTSVVVSPGQSVGKGQVIGYVGTTGQSTGPHLHFECRLNGVRYNPMDELSAYWGMVSY